MFCAEETLCPAPWISATDPVISELVLVAVPTMVIGAMVVVVSVPALTEAAEMVI